jgi:acetyl-CoA acetyltransferase
MSREALIVAAARTAVGTAYRGSLADVDAMELAPLVVAEAVRRSGLPPELVDAGEHGLAPLAIVRAGASAGVPPAETGLAPRCPSFCAAGRPGARGRSP